MERYDESAIEIADPVSHVRCRKMTYLGREDVVPDDLANKLAADALALGVAGVEVHHCGCWWLVSSADDWLLRENTFSVEEIFSNIVPLAGGGQDAIRGEILLKAFASEVFSRKGEEFTWVSGGLRVVDEELDACLKTIPAEDRVVGFRV